MCVGGEGSTRNHKYNGLWAFESGQKNLQTKRAVTILTEILTVEEFILLLYP